MHNRFCFRSPIQHKLILFIEGQWQSVTTFSIDSSYQGSSLVYYNNALWRFGNSTVRDKTYVFLEYTVLISFLSQCTASSLNCSSVDKFDLGEYYIPLSR